ncbi:FAD-binding oxidoreductase [Thermococcus sp. EP1]|uniref:FAD-binding oxidoreductase n=1 Tax=Thermococcus sp. EP1 TaxID=1591054 RepID=UPI00209CAC92|nr:FAD-binding oxidoreductase [Thermococcus sp. EP1]
MTNFEVVMKSNHELPSDVLKHLISILGNRISTKDVDLLSYSRDYWPITLHWMLKGKIPALARAIVWPKNTKEVQEVVKIAYENDIPIYTYGGGSGVLGGAIPEQGGIVVDMKKMRSIKLHEENLLVEVEAGTNGYYLEKYLNKKGYTLGHFPQSLYPSTIGGWIATKATGQFSTKYGGIEDMVLGLEAVLPWGDVVTLKPHVRSATGPDLKTLFIGSEGILGIITKAWLKIWPYPEKRILLSFASETLEEALDSVNRILKRGARPAVVRIYDVVETKRHFYKFDEVYGKIATIIILEGDSKLVEAEKQIIEEEFKGKALGEDLVKHWLETRFNVKEASEFAPLGVVFDTIEVSIHWNKAIKLYRSLINVMRSVKGTLFASAHASHFYPQGVCFYFTFAGIPKGDPTEYYNKVWDAAMKTTLEVGGAISHHHGIGRQRGKWLKEDLGPAFEVLKRVKNALDEKKIMNPRNMEV